MNGNIEDAKKYQRQTGCSWEDALEATGDNNSEPVPAGLLADNFDLAEFACGEVRKRILDGNGISAEFDCKDLDDDELLDKLKSMGLSESDAQAYLKAKNDGSGVAIRILLYSLPMTDQLRQALGLYMALDYQEGGYDPEYFTEGIITATGYRDAISAINANVDRLDQYKAGVEKEFKRIFSGNDRKWVRGIFRDFLDDYIKKVHDEKAAEANR